MSRLHFVGGEKGGVGKSVLARLLAQYYIDHNIAFRAFDADPSHGAMRRYYAEFSAAVDLARTADADPIIDLAASADLQVIIDLAAQTAAPLASWIEETDLVALCAELQLGITMWHVMDDGTDSARLLEQLINTYGAAPNYVVVRNLGRGSDFSAFDRSSVRQLAEQHGALFMDLRALHAPTMLKIDRIDASFWAAANHQDPSQGPGLGLMERQRVRIWLRKSYADLNLIHRALGVLPPQQE